MGECFFFFFFFFLMKIFFVFFDSLFLYIFFFFFSLFYFTLLGGEINYSKEPKSVTAFDLFTFFSTDLIQSEAS